MGFSGNWEITAVEVIMIPRIKKLEVLDDLKLKITFDDQITVCYDVSEDIKNIPSYRPLQYEKGLFENAKVDESRTVVFWNDYIDLPSDSLYEYGTRI